MQKFTNGQAVTLVRTNVINDQKFVGKKAVVDLAMKDGMVWIKVGRSFVCVHQEELAAI